MPGTISPKYQVITTNIAKTIRLWVTSYLLKRIRNGGAFNDYTWESFQETYLPKVALISTVHPEVHKQYRAIRKLIAHSYFEYEFFDIARSEGFPSCWRSDLRWLAARFGYREHLRFSGTRLHGRFGRFSKSGKLVIDGRFKNGVEDSVWSFYDAESRLIARKYFVNGELTKTESFENAVRISDREHNTRQETIRNKYFHLVIIALLIVTLVSRLVLNYNHLSDRSASKFIFTIFSGNIWRGYTRLCRCSTFVFDNLFLLKIEKSVWFGLIRSPVCAFGGVSGGMDLFKGYLKLAYVSNRVMVGFLNGRIGSKMKRQFAIIFLVILVSCGPEQKKFDRSTWNEMDDFFLRQQGKHGQGFDGQPFAYRNVIRRVDGLNW